MGILYYNLFTKGKLPKSDDLDTTYPKNTHGTPFSVKIYREIYVL